MGIGADIKRYFKTPIFYLSGGVTLLGVFILFGALGLGWLGAVVSDLALWGLESFILIQTPIGAKAIVAARDRENAERAEGAVAAAQADYERLSVLRLADPELAKTRDYLAQMAGEYLAAAKRQRTHSPVADQLIREGLETIDLFLKESDEAATEKRYGLADADPFADAKTRVQNSLLEKASALREERIRIDGGLPPVLAYEAKEELK
jgi:hypothetical protein